MVIVALGPAPLDVMTGASLRLVTETARDCVAASTPSDAWTTTS